MLMIHDYTFLFMQTSLVAYAPLTLCLSAIKYDTINIFSPKYRFKRFYFDFKLKEMYIFS